MRNQNRNFLPAQRGGSKLVGQDNPTDKDLSKASENAERDETVTAIREGLADVKAGRTKPARTALKALAKRHGLKISKG